MRRILSPIGAALVIAACSSTFDDLKTGMDGLIGWPINNAVNRLGYPDDQVAIGDDTIYVWSSSRHGSYSLPTTEYVAHEGDLVPVAGEQTISYDYQCTLKVVVDGGGLIKTWQVEGNAGGCERYAERLR